MPRNQTTGVYTAPDSSWNPAVAGTVIDPEDWNSLRTDIVSGMNTIGGLQENTTISWPFDNPSVPDGSGSFRIQQTETVADAAPLLDVIRTITHGDGTLGFVVPAIRALMIVNSSASTSDNRSWAGVFEIRNSMTGGTGRAVALNGTARKLSTGWTWGSNFVLEDYLEDPTTGSLGMELDMYCNGTDANNARIGIDVFTRVVPGQEGVWTAPTVYAGLRFSTGIGASGGTFKNGILFNDATFTKLIGTTATASITDGIDLSASTISGNAFKSNGFNVTGAGALTASSGTITFALAAAGSIAAGSGGSSNAFLIAAGNNNGTRPPQSAGSVIGYNYSGGGGETDFWNTLTSATVSFSWKQKTGASTHDDLMSLTPAGLLTAVSFAGSGAALTSLDAGNITAGTLARGRGGTGTTTGAAVRVASQVFTSSGTYTPATGLLYAVIEGVGCGAGGGGVAGSASQGGSAGSGGCGSYSRTVASAAAIGASQVVTIGSAGPGGAAGNNAGTAGGDVSVGSLMVAKGGSPGSGAAANSPGTAGAGGVAGTGDFTPTGAPGQAGNGAPSVTVGTTGASSLFGGGGIGTRAVNAATAGGNATNYGAGGGGAAFHNTTSTAAGGNGAAGIVIITEYINQ